MLEMYGKGWPGSTARGVSTGKMRSSNVSTRNFSSSSSRSAHDDSRMPASASAGDTWSRNTACIRGSSLSRRSRMSRSCCAAVRPSGLVVATPAATWSFRPATRTWKNSSRF
jgi:hypothetical protein